MSLTEIRVPDIGDFRDVDVIEIMVKAGDSVKKDQSLIMLESDKASMEIPSPHAGVVREMRLAAGDRVSEGSLILLMDTSDTSGEALTPETESGEPPPAEPPPAPPAPPSPAPPQAAALAPASPPPEGALPHASPSIRKFARELGVDLGRVTGSGPKGRILREDVQSFVKAVMAGGGAGTGFDFPPWPSLDFSAFGPTEIQPLSRIRRISGPNLHRNRVMIPHVTQFEDADVTELDAFMRSENRRLEEEGVRLTILSFVIKACVTVLKEYPHFNASLDESRQNLILRHYYHIAFAADTPDGLVVPVVKNADQKGVIEIAREVADLAGQAREGRIRPADLQGACFTVTSLGSIGGTAFTPFINAPEVAIVGLSRMSMKPVWNGSEFVPRLILPLSLAYDHRAIDGAEGVRFIGSLADVLGEMKKTLL